MAARPIFEDAGPSDEARRLSEQIAAGLGDQGTHVETDFFAAHMLVEWLNNGPVTFVLASREA
jgi:D-aminoacyl-tRNA deacylase